MIVILIFIAGFARLLCSGVSLNRAGSARVSMGIKHRPCIRALAAQEAQEAVWQSFLFGVIVELLKYA